MDRVKPAGAGEASRDAIGPEALREIRDCEVCGGRELVSVLNLGLHPLCDDLVPIGDPRECSEYPIEIVLCPECLTAHQRFQVPKVELFPSTYHYRSRFTADVLNGMQGLVESCVSRLGSFEGKSVLDIGCNDGSLLGFFRDAGAKTIGIEPTGAAEDARKEGHIVYRSYLNSAAAQRIVDENGHPDLITFTNVFAHIEDLRGVIEALRILSKPTTAIVIENHYLGSVLDGNQFDTFYHEHPRTYSVRSFMHVAASLGSNLSVVEFPSRYGGNVRVYLNIATSKDGDARVREAAAREEYFASGFSRMRDDMERWRRLKRGELASLVSEQGGLTAKAFPGRAAILVKLLGLTAADICAVSEKPGSMKIGHYIPGTRIPIRSDDEVFGLATAPPIVLNLAWHISKEIRSYLRDLGYDGVVIDIMSPGDAQRAS